MSIYIFKCTYLLGMMDTSIPIIPKRAGKYVNTFKLKFTFKIYKTVKLECC